MRACFARLSLFGSEVSSNRWILEVSMLIFAFGDLFLCLSLVVAGAVPIKRNVEGVTLRWFREWLLGLVLILRGSG